MNGESAESRKEIAWKQKRAEVDIIADKLGLALTRISKKRLLPLGLMDLPPARPVRAISKKIKGILFRRLRFMLLSRMADKKARAKKENKKSESGR